MSRRLGGAAVKVEPEPDRAAGHVTSTGSFVAFVSGHGRAHVYVVGSCGPLRAPTFFSGFGRCLDMWSTFDRQWSASALDPWGADAAAVAWDWRVTADDLRAALVAQEEFRRWSEAVRAEAEFHRSAEGTMRAGDKKRGPTPEAPLRSRFVRAPR